MVSTAYLAKREAMLRGPSKLSKWWKKTPWQDKTLAAGGVVFTVSLIPSIMEPTTMIPLWSSVPTAFFLGVFAYVMKSLKLKLAMITNFATATMWWVLAMKQVF